MEQKNVRVEMPIPENSKILAHFKTIGDLKKRFNQLMFVKYIYLDPIDNQLKGANPPNELPLVANAYITVAGEYNRIIEFSKQLTV